MKIKAIKTRKVLPTDRGLTEFLDKNIPKLKERSVLAITSKVAAILEGSVVPINSIAKDKLIIREADQWLAPRRKSKFGIILAVKNGMLIPTSGIDESNGDGWYILWPKDPQKTANLIRKHLAKKFGLRELGVIVTDSTSRFLLRGTFGVGIAHSGFLALKDYVGSPDIFGRKMRMTKANHMEALAAAAVLMMGEGAERMPLTVIEDLPFIQFQKRDPSPSELRQMRIGMSEDIYAPLFDGVKWKKGGTGRGREK